MTGILSEIFLYKGSEVDNALANYLIDVVYREKKLFLINTEIKKEGEKLRKEQTTNLINSKNYKE